MTLTQARIFFEDINLSYYELELAGQILQEMCNRLKYLDDVGLGYLSLNRRTATLSGGEYQRINLATALGAKLVGSLYILDEPTIGLHPRDTQKLIGILKALRDIGNTVLIVEHDREMMEISDRIIDLGPQAGENGGEIVFQGTYKDIRNSGVSLTGAYLRGNKQIPVPDQRRARNAHFLEIIGASEHNLKDIDVSIPLGVFVIVTGVSGSGKSSLIHDVLYNALTGGNGKEIKQGGKYRDIRGAHYIDKVIMVDQSPIGKTPRSNPATYVKALDPIRQVFAATNRSRIKGLKPGAFSFNIPGGRCEVCNGAGSVKIEMQFLADIFIECDACGGKRYKKDILEIKLRGKSIADVLEMSVTEAMTFFKNEPSVTKKLKLLAQVGLGYMRLGQPATTLSGGEAQRVKLAAHLGEKSGKHMLYLFDEPTTGLHFDDVLTLLACFDRLIESGNTVLVIEHNMDVIKCADYIIDLGPEGGEAGGFVVATGTPEDLVRQSASHTGKKLHEYLGL
jgi:excinuclease ABC subunit A